MFEAAEVGHRISKATYTRREPGVRAGLLEVQRQLAVSPTAGVGVVGGAACGAAGGMGVAAPIHNSRIEEVAPFAADVVTARALAPLDRLLALAAPFLAPGTVALFPKGRAAEAELTDSRKHWTMSVERIPSRSDPAGTVLRLKDIAREPPG